MPIDFRLCWYKPSFYVRRQIDASKMTEYRHSTYEESHGENDDW